MPPLCTMPKPLAHARANRTKKKKTSEHSDGEPLGALNIVVDGQRAEERSRVSIQWFTLYRISEANAFNTTDALVVHIYLIRVRVANVYTL